MTVGTARKWLSIGPCHKPADGRTDFLRLILHRITCPLILWRTKTFSEI